MAYTTINKPSDYFNTVLYTQNATARSITGVGHQPDMVWFKDRGASDRDHRILDSVRGVGKLLKVNGSGAENTQADTLTSFDSDGFSLGVDSSLYGLNGDNGNNNVSWNWKANGTGVSNTDGSITSTVSANTTSGFSIGTYTGNVTAGSTVGHGLGNVPKVVITKSTSHTSNWAFYHYSNGAGNRLVLNATDASSSNNGYWNSTDPSSSVFTLGDEGNDTNGSGKDYVFYAFAEKPGFSKFGSYTGNGSTDGTFVYTGFKPAFVMVKLTSGADDWQILDNKRNTFNIMNEYLRPNSSGSTTTNDVVDFLSNGFKLRTSAGSWNPSGGSFIYMAFAESPLVGTNNIPATAR